jgi:hypothetical protein
VLPLQPANCSAHSSVPSVAPISEFSSSNPVSVLRTNHQGAERCPDAPSVTRIQLRQLLSTSSVPSTNRQSSFQAFRNPVSVLRTNHHVAVVCPSTRPAATASNQANCRDSSVPLVAPISQASSKPSAPSSFGPSNEPSRS